jgi:hypothetical protein
MIKTYSLELFPSYIESVEPTSIPKVKNKKVSNKIDALLATPPTDGDRSKNDFRLCAKLIDLGWSIESIADAMRDEKNVKGFGAKFSEQGEDYLKRTITKSFEDSESTGIIHIGNEKIKVRQTAIEFFDKFNSIYSQESNDGKNQYIQIQGNESRLIPQKEIDCMFSAMSKIVDSSNDAKQHERNRLALIEELHSNRRIVDDRSHVVPFGESRFSIDLISKGKYELVHTSSFEETLKKFLRSLSHIERIPELDNLIETEYSEILDIFSASLARRFSGNKKSTVWVHAPSNFGKTFFFIIKTLVIKVNKSYTEMDFRGLDPLEFDDVLMVFIDEADKFTASMKDDILSYHRLYKGLTTAILPMRVMASANEISDLTNAVDDQIQNRVTKIKLPEKKIADKLREIGLTPDVAYDCYRKYLAEFLINKLNEWKIHIDNPVGFKKAVSREYQDFLDKYNGNLEVTNFDEMVIEEVQDIINSLFYIKNDMDFDPQQINIEDKKTDNTELSDHNFRKFFIPSGEHIYLVGVSSFLDLFKRERLGSANKQFSFGKSYPNISVFAKIFSEYKNNRIDGTQKQSIVIHIKKGDVIRKGLYDPLIVPAHNDKGGV